MLKLFAAPWRGALALSEFALTASADLVQGVIKGLFGPDWDKIKEEVGPESARFLKKLTQGGLHPKLENVLAKNSVQKDLLLLLQNPALKKQFCTLDHDQKIRLLKLLQNPKIQKQLARFLEDKALRRKTFYEWGLTPLWVVRLEDGRLKTVSRTSTGHKMIVISATPPAEPAPPTVDFKALLDAFADGQ